MSRKSKKETISEAIFKILPEHNKYKDLTTEQLLFRWWVTGRGGDGLRLTDEGMDAFSLADITFYHYPLKLKDKQTTIHVSKFTVEIGKKIKCPFYIGVDDKKKPYIRLFDSKIAMMVNLYGSIEEYLKSIEVKHE